MKINKIFVLFMIFACSYAFGQPSEADFVLLQKDYVLNADGSSDMHCRQVVKYNTHVSFNRLYGETFIVYNPQQQQLKFNESYTVQASGNKIVTPQNAFNEVLPRFAADAPAYNHLREMVVTHTGLELGATAYLDYTLHTNAGYMPELDRCLSLQEESPVKEYKVTVTVPDSKKLAYRLHGAKADPKVTKKAGTTHYEWTLRNVTASSREYYQPEDGRNAPHLVFSTWPSQQAALQWMTKQIKPGDTKEIQAVFGKIPVKEKDENETDPNFRLTNAYRYIVDNIAFTPIPAEYAGYRLRDAAQVVKQAYGTVGEKAALLLAVAKDLGIDAYCVAVYPSYIDGSVGSLHAIADIAVAVNAEEKDFLLSPAKYTEMSLSISRPNWRYVPMTGNAAEIVAKNSIHAIAYMEIVANPQQVKTSGFSYLTNTVPSEEPEEHTAGTLPIKGNDDFFSFTLPEVTGGFNSWTLPYLGLKRLITLEIPYSLTESYTYILWAPADQEFINKDMTIEKKNTLGWVNIQIEKRALNYYQVTRNLHLSKSIIAPAEYDAFMELMSVWRNPNYRTIMFK